MLYQHEKVFEVILLLEPRSLHYIALNFISVKVHVMDGLRVHSKYSWHCPGYQHGQNMERSISKVTTVCPRTRSPTVVLLVGNEDEARRFCFYPLLC